MTANPARKSTADLAAKKTKKKSVSRKPATPRKGMEMGMGMGMEKMPYTSALLLTVKEAAGLLRISERKMYYLLARQVITSLKIDNATRIKRSVVDDYIATLERASA